MNPQDSGTQKDLESLPELTICIDLPYDQPKNLNNSSKSKSKRKNPEWLENFQQRICFYKPKKVFQKTNFSRKIKTYEELLKIINSYDYFCKNNNKSHTFTNFTASCVWFLINAVYFSRKDYVFYGKKPENLFDEALKDLNDVKYVVLNRLTNENLVLSSLNDDLFLSELKRLPYCDNDEIINELETQLQSIQLENESKLNEIKQKLKDEYTYLHPIIQFLNKSPYNILIDLDNNSKAEIDFLDYLESKQQDPKGFTLESLRRSNNLNLEPSDIVCQICNDGDFTDDNLIVFCSLCSITVHQKCYELPSLPDSDWVCDLCRKFGCKAKNMRCPLCSRRGGAMKPTAFSIDDIIFETLNPNYHSFQLDCVKYFENNHIKLEENHEFKEKIENENPKPKKVKISTLLKHNKYNNDIDQKSRKTSRKKEIIDENANPKENLNNECVAINEGNTGTLISNEDNAKVLSYNVEKASKSRKKSKGIDNINENNVVLFDKSIKVNRVCCKTNRITPHITNAVIHENPSDNNQINGTPRPDRIWVHLSCALWIPEVYFDEMRTDNNIKGLDAIDTWRFSMQCGVCRMKKIGAIVQCSGLKCSSFFHIECARRVGMYLEIIDLRYILYCDKHIPLKLKRILVQRAVKSREEILKYVKGLYKQQSNFFYAKKIRGFEGANLYFTPNTFKKRKRSLKKDKFIIKLKKNNENTYTVIGIKYGQNKEYVRKKFNLRDVGSKNLKTWGLACIRENLNSNFLQKAKKTMKLKKLKKLKRNLKNKKITKKNNKILYQNYSKRMKNIKKKKNLIKKIMVKKENISKKTNMNDILIEENENNSIKLPLIKIENMNKSAKSSKFTIFSEFNSLNNNCLLKDFSYNNIVNNNSRLTNINKKILPLINTVNKIDDTNNISSSIEISSSDTRLYCICQRKYDGIDNMMCCCICEEWFHFKCIGFKGGINDAENINFVCKACDLHESFMIRLKRRNNYNNLFENYYEDIDELDFKNQSMLHKLAEIPVKVKKEKGLKKNLGYNIMKKWGESQQEKEYQEIALDIDNFIDGLNDYENLRKIIKI